MGAAIWYSRKPQRDAEQFLRVLRRVQVDQTTTQDLNKLLQTEGPKGVRLWCSPDLERLTRHFPTVDFPLPRTPDKPFEIVFPGLKSYECRYDYKVTNALLHWLRLAPLTGATFSVTTNSKVVVAMGFHTEISFGNMTESDPFGYLAWINVGEAQQRMRLTAHLFCEQPICVKKTNVTPPGYADGWMIDISSAIPLSERNRLLALNTVCFAKPGGCKSARDLLPITEIR